MALTRGLGCLEERCNSLFFFLNEIVIYQQQQEQLWVWYNKKYPYKVYHTNGVDTWFGMLGGEM